MLAAVDVQTYQSITGPFMGSMNLADKPALRDALLELLAACEEAYAYEVAAGLACNQQKLLIQDARLRIRGLSKLGVPGRILHTKRHNLVPLDKKLSLSHRDLNDILLCIRSGLGIDCPASLRVSGANWGRFLVSTNGPSRLIAALDAMAVNADKYSVTKVRKPFSAGPFSV